MKTARCLVCCESTTDPAYHPRCAKKLFGTSHPPVLEFAPKEIENLAKQLIKSHVAIPGVQRKISLALSSQESGTSRLTIMGVLGGTHILKPPSVDYPELPELEHITMRLAESSGIDTAPNGLITLGDGSRAYIVKRFDRYTRGKKLAVEDLCQLSELPSESKYRGSTESAGKIVRKYSHNPGDDALRFFELILFSFLTGNSDMHLKNFSLLENKENTLGLSPAYDLLATQLLINDPEESALTINGKRSRLRREDFQALGKSLKIPESVLEKTINRQLELQVEWLRLMDNSFLSEKMKAQLASLISERRKRLMLHRGNSAVI